MSHCRCSRGGAREMVERWFGAPRRPREGEVIWRRQADGGVTLPLVQGRAREMALHWVGDLRWRREGKATWRRGKSKSTS